MLEEDYSILKFNIALLSLKKAQKDMGFFITHCLKYIQKPL